MIGLAIILTVQASPSAPVQPPLDTTPAPWPDHERKLGMVDAYSTEGQPGAKANDPASRLALKNWTACLARRNPGEVGRARKTFSVNPIGLRAMLATSAFRLIESLKDN